jgi:AraC-like DNA-binding protein
MYFSATMPCRQRRLSSNNVVMMPTHSDSAALDLQLPTFDRARVVDVYAQTALDTALAAGVTGAALGFAGGLPGTLTVGRYIDLLEQAASLTGDPAFGLHVGERMRPSTFATYSHVILSSPTFCDAVIQTRRFEGLAHDLGRTELLVEGDVASYRWHSPWLERRPSRHLPESVMSGIVSFANWLACAPILLFGVSFPHAPDPALDRAEYLRIFGTEVCFNAPVTEARFPAAVLDIAIPNADRTLLPVVERHAAQLLAIRVEALKADEIIHQVRRCIADQLAFDKVSISDVAQTLNMSVRSLQRRLGDAHSRFGDLLDATRSDLAQAYLINPAFSLTEIAFLLGYHQQSSFSHAFRQWHHCSPQQWRAARQSPTG